MDAVQETLNILERHAPERTLIGYLQYRCTANGCFFETGNGEGTWFEFAAHLQAMLIDGDVL